MKQNANVPARVHVYEWVRDSIIRGDFMPGEFLEQGMVCDATGVSRTPVREAFQELAADKFITLLPRRGAQVRGVSANELIEVYETRRLIEGHAAERICADRIPVTLEARNALNERLSLSEAALESPGDAALRAEATNADWKLHRAIVAATGNSVLTECYESLRSRQQRVSLTTATTRPKLIAEFDRQHVLLLEAWQDHDAATFREVLSNHLRPVREIIAELPKD